MRKRRHRAVTHKDTAYHEAGHAVIALRLGYNVKKATSRPAYSYLGSAWDSNKRSLGSTEVQAGSLDSDADLVGHICVDLAGTLAEQLVSRSSFEELIRHWSSADWRNAQKRARRINRRQAGTLIDALIEETRALVQQHREAI